MAEPEISKPNIVKKICLIGDFGVGKTSLIRRFVDHQFSQDYLSTVGVQISRKLVEFAIKEGEEQQQVQLVIWDLEGSTKFQPIASSYVQGSQGAIVVADLNRQETIAHLQEHLSLVTEVNPKGIKVIVAFNKSDLIAAEELETIRLENPWQVDSRVLGTYLTSAKTGQNVEEVFQQLALSLL